MIQTARRAIGSAHGKLILIGEHSVVYGKPALALPFPLLEVVSTVEAGPEQIEIDCDYFKGPLSEIPRKFAGLAFCVEETLRVLNRPKKGLSIRLHSAIPIGRGLGSSAAIAIAIVKSIFRFFDEKADVEKILPIVHVAETFAHGNPSGIDMMAASSDFPIWFQKGHEMESVKMKDPLFLVVADTGRYGDTHSTVLSVKEAYDTDPRRIQSSLDRLAECTLESRKALAEGDHPLLGRLLDLAQIELCRLGVSDQGIDRLVEVARAAGALGAKLTGGGRGGCILALARNLNHARVIARTLMKAGACNAWYFKVETNW